MSILSFPHRGLIVWISICHLVLKYLYKHHFWSLENVSVSIVSKMYALWLMCKFVSIFRSSCKASASVLLDSEWWLIKKTYWWHICLLKDEISYFSQSRSALYTYLSFRSSFDMQDSNLTSWVFWNRIVMVVVFSHYNRLPRFYFNLLIIS